MCSGEVLTTIRKAEYVELMALFLALGAAISMWFVPLTTVLDAHGLGDIKPWAYASSALAAFVSPLIFGALADRQVAPVRVLRGLALATSAAMAVASAAIHFGWSRWAVLVCIQLHALCSSPTFSLTTAIVLQRLSDPRREFGPVRAMATLGWMAGCCVVSLLGADTSALAGWSGAVMWLVVAVFTFFLPAVAPPAPERPPRWHERLGLDALTLLRHPDHRVVYITTTLFCIPLAAFYPYAPPHMRDLGLQHTTAWMSFGQISEVIAMFGLGVLLLNWRLKWVFALGLGFGVLRFVFSAMDTRAWLLLGVALHGCTFALVQITAQIYLDQRVESAWRVRAQSLMALLNGGVGNLVGYLGGGLWFSYCAATGQSRWPVFWIGLATVVGIVLAYFLSAYRGVGSGFLKAKTDPAVSGAD